MAGARLQPCHEIASLSALREEWAELHRRSPQATTFNGFEHVELWYQRFASPEAVRTYSIRAGGRTLGFLPLVAEHRTGVRFLRSLTNSHCFHGAALIGASPRADFAAATLEALRRDRDWDVLLLEHEYSFSGGSLLSAEALQASGLKWEQSELPTFVITLGKPFEEYFRKDLSRKRRHYLVNYVHRLERAGGGAFEHLRDAEAAAAWEEFVDIEDAGWKGSGGTSIRREIEPLREYYRGLVDLLARQGRLRISFMTLGGRRIAGGFGHLQDGVLHLAKMGYRQEFGQYAPSSLLLLQLVKDADLVCPRGRAIHLYPWDHGYKHRFVNDTAAAVSTWVFNDTARGRAARLWRAWRSATAGPATAAPAPSPRAGSR